MLKDECLLRYLKSKFPRICRRCLLASDVVSCQLSIMMKYYLKMLLEIVALFCYTKCPLPQRLHFHRKKKKKIQGGPLMYSLQKKLFTICLRCKYEPSYLRMHHTFLIGYNLFIEFSIKFHSEICLVVTSSGKAIP